MIFLFWILSMGRPRKNRVGEYAELLAEELAHQLKQEMQKIIVADRKAYRDEISALRSEVRKLTKQVETLSKKSSRSGKPRVGKWVPGGPGRPPKDAAERIAAFENRHKNE